jgi:hypothetical protein
LHPRIENGCAGEKTGAEISAGVNGNGQPKGEASPSDQQPPGPKGFFCVGEDLRMFGDDAHREADENGGRDCPDDYERHLAAEIIAMLPYVRSDADRVLRFVHEMLNVTLQPAEQPSELQQK